MTASQDTAHTLQEIADALGASVVGDGAHKVTRIVHPLQAEGPEDLIFLLDANAAPILESTPAGGAVVPEGLDGTLAGGLIPVPDTRWALATLLDIFNKPVHAPAGVHPSAAVDATATLGEGVSVGPLASIGPGAVIGANTTLQNHVSVGADARVGANCLLHAGVRVGERVAMGDRCIIQAGAVIGADGFSHVTPGRGSWEEAKTVMHEVTIQNTEIRRINSIGTVILGDDVEIGANSCIDRANLGATMIGNNTRIDNLVQVAHNTRIGENCLISGQVGISGSVVIGDRVVIAGGSGIADHTKIGDDAVIAAGSGVWKDVPPRHIIAGFPAFKKADTAVREMNIARIGRLLKDLESVKKRLAAIERKNGGTDS